MTSNTTPARMIPNSNPAIRAVFDPAGVQPYTLPVVAWADNRKPFVPTAEGHLALATGLPDFVRLERDVRFVDEGQESLEEDLAEEAASQAPIEVPEDRRPQPRR